MSVSLVFIDSLGRKYFVSKVVSDLFYLLSEFVDICQLDSILSSNTGTQGFRRFSSYIYIAVLHKALDVAKYI